MKEAADYRAETTTPFGTETVQLLTDIINLQRQIADKKHQAISTQTKNLLVLLTIIIVISLGIAIALAILLSSNITEVVLGSVKDITTASSRISSTVSDQERTIVDQSISMNETTSIIEEVGSFALQSAQQAETSAEGAKQALFLSEGGTQTVGNTMEGIAALKDQVTAIANQIIRLSEQTGQISTVSELMADLATQTNMLALNAGVEAARAGDQGKGFAVVAAEIRKLADQSKKSAERINTLVHQVQGAINSTIMVTDEGTKKATYGLKLVEETGDVFTKIADAINHVFLNTQQIAENAKHQSVAVQQAVSAMNAINLGAKETATDIILVKDATKDLDLAAHNLQNLKRFVGEKHKK